MIVRFESLSGARFRKLVSEQVTVIVPCAPLEVHGPHLSLATDIIQSEHYGNALAERLGASFPDRHFLIHPTLPLGVDPLPLAGSIGHDLDLVRRVVVRIGESMFHAGVHSMVITNFHGAPRHVLAHELACDDLHALGFPAIAPMGLMLGDIVESSLGDQLEILREHLDDDTIAFETHAGALETSILMAMGHAPDEEHRRLPALDFRASGGRIADFLRSLRGSATPRVGLPKFLWQLEALLRATDHFNRHSYGGDPRLATRVMGEAAIERFTQMQLEILQRFFSSSDPRAEEFQSVFWKHRRLILSGVIERLFDGGWNNRFREGAPAS